MTDSTADTVRTSIGRTADYLAGVRAALSDLPEAEVAEILDDVSGHLAEITADGGDDALDDRLGTPQQYAAELRAAAGYPPAPPPPPVAVDVDAGPSEAAAQWAVAALVLSTVLMAASTIREFGFGLVLLAVLVATTALPVLRRDGPSVPSVAALPVVRQFVGTAPDPASGLGQIGGYVASLQSAWWLVRGVVAAVLVSTVFGRPGVLPIVLVSLLLVPGSIWVGLRSRRDRRWLWLVVPLNAFAVAIALSLITWVSRSDATSVQQYPTYGLTQDGVSITDIRPVDAQGTPLTGVYLFDQDGRPLDTDFSGCPQTSAAYDPNPAPLPYPRGTVSFDDLGRCVVVPPGPLVVAVPSATPTTSPTPTAGSDPTAPTSPVPPTG